MPLAPIGASRVRRYVAKRLLMLVPVLLGASLVIFILIRLIPGDAALVMLGARARPDSIQQFNQRYGLDQPLPVQYVLWLFNVVQGNLGDSLRTHQPVLKELLARLPHTIELSFFSILIGALAGLILGVVAAIHRNQPRRRVIDSHLARQGWSVLSGCGRAAGLSAAGAATVWLPTPG